MAIPRLFDFKAKSLIVADQVDAEFQNLINAIEGIATAAGGADVYQAGVLASTDWIHVERPINEVSGVFELTEMGGVAWLPGLSGGLVRTFTAPQNWKGLKSPLLPAPGGFVAMGIEISQVGSSAIVSVVAGAEQVSEAAALANPPAVSAGKTRIRDLVLRNAGGKYTIPIGRDRRPWARGFNSSLNQGAEAVAEPGGLVLIPGLIMRAEFSGAPVRAAFTCLRAWNGATGSVLVNLKVDGVQVGLSEWESRETQKDAIPLSCDFTPVPGSHLIEALLEAGIMGGKARLVGGCLAVTELVRQNANNGNA